MDQLEGHAAGHADGGVGPRRLGGQQGQGRADALAAGALEWAARRCRSSRGGRTTRRRDVGGQPVDGGHHGRRDQLPGAGQGVGHADRRGQPSSVVVGSRHLLGAVRRDRAGAVEGARAAARPLRSAPSIVAGQPVSVHAPASHRPGMSVFGPGRSAARCRARPERGGALLGHQRVDHRGPAAAGRSRGSSAVTSATISSSGRRPMVLVGGRQRHGQVLARPGAARARPDDAVRSKSHCSRGVDPGQEREVGDPAVVGQVHVDDRRACRARRAGPGGRWRRAGARRRPSVWGRATTTASASTVRGLGARRTRPARGRLRRSTASPVSP